MAGVAASHSLLPTVENVQKTVTLPLAVSFPAKCVFFLLSHFWGSLRCPVSAITGFAPSSAKRGRFLVNADPARALYLSVSLSGCRRQAPSSRENLLKLTGWTVAAASSPTFSAMSNCPRSRFCQLGTQIFGKRFSANNFCDRENQRSREVRLLSLINGWHRHDGESEDQVVLV